jgi:hypothetical protein
VISLDLVVSYIVEWMGCENIPFLAAVKKPILEPEKVPMQIGHWLVYEILEPVPGSTWTNDGHYEMVCQQINCIDNEVVKHFYPKGVGPF